MIIANLVGGLGNQLFQYAMARRLAIKHHSELVLDASNYRQTPDEVDLPAGLGRQLRLFNFRVHARQASPAEIASLRDPYWTRSPRHRLVRLTRRFWPNFLWRKSHVLENQYRFQPEALDFPDNVYLSGFWQSEKYFADITSVIREEFELLDDSVAESARNKIDALRQHYGTIVSLHVRRGDLVYAFETLRQKHLVHGPPLQSDYFQRAMAQFDPSSCFFVFSDSSNDIEWCKQNIKATNLKFSDAKSELWDFMAMRSCDHHIIANSSFSWWAAWLNSKPERRVIAPGKWSGAEAKTEMPIDDLIPRDWIVI